MGRLAKLQRGFTLVELMIVVAIIAILASIAIPNFLKFQARAKQSEAKANLKAIFTAQKAFFQEKDRFSTMTGEVGFEPERNNRYAYFLDQAGPLQDRSAATIVAATTYTGVRVDVFKYGTANGMDQTSAPDLCTGGGTIGAAARAFVAAAAGNIDADSTIDVWSIASASRQLSACSADADNPSGEPANDVNDVTR